MYGADSSVDTISGVVPATDPACLLIADISGYTSYLAGVELDHAQDILAELMNTVVKALRPTFKLSKLEGDAAFVYTITEEVDGSMLLDTAETCYFAFRNRLLSIRQATTCECNACSSIPTLNVKLVAHHGQIAIQKIAGHTELVGNHVILIHRLLKNSIPEPAYLFITDACMAKTTLEPRQLGFRRHAEEYEHIGEVGGWIDDLETAWNSTENTSRYMCPPTKQRVPCPASSMPRPNCCGSSYPPRCSGRSGWPESAASTNSIRVEGGGPALSTIACTAKTYSSRSSSIGARRATTRRE